MRSLLLEYIKLPTAIHILFPKRSVESTMSYSAVQNVCANFRRHATKRTKQPSQQRTPVIFGVDILSEYEVYLIICSFVLIFLYYSWHGEMPPDAAVPLPWQRDRLYQHPIFMRWSTGLPWRLRWTCSLMHRRWARRQNLTSEFTVNKLGFRWVFEVEFLAKVALWVWRFLMSTNCYLLACIFDVILTL